MRYRISIIGLCLGLILALSPLGAAAEGNQATTPHAKALEGMERLIEALEGLMDSIPQYELPSLDENGDIIIRRKRQPSQRPESADPQFEETST